MTLVAGGNRHLHGKIMPLILDLQYHTGWQFKRVHYDTDLEGWTQLYIGGHTLTEWQDAILDRYMYNNPPHVHVDAILTGQGVG